jgi:RNA polymerase sigma factor (sigma-70 family)
MTTSPPETELRSGTGSQSPACEDLARHHRLLQFAIKRYLRARPDLADDILAVARATLADALRSYRAVSGIAFSTYATHQMRWRVCRFLGHFTRKDSTTASLDEPRGEGEDGEFTLADVADAQNAVREESAAIADEHLLRRIHDLREAITVCATLTASEREILDAFLECGNGAAVAARLNLTTARVSQALVSAGAKLRKHLQVTPDRSG